MSSSCPFGITCSSGRSGRAHLLLALALGLFAACSVGGGGDGVSGGGGVNFGEDNGEDGGPAAPPVSVGEIAATVETILPGASSFILRSNIPVPPNTFPRTDGLLPFTIRDFDGTPLETQTEIVSHYADWNEGADVVEVMALVRRDPSMGSGSLAQYSVTASPRNAPSGPGTPDIADLASPLNLPSEVSALIADPQGIEIASYDCFGNKYVAYPLDGTGNITVLSHGRVETKLRVYQTMVAVSPRGGSTGTLPHFFGVHSYITTHTGENRVGLDVRFSNGHSGADTSTSLDDPLGKLYFSRIDVSMQANWFLEQGFTDPTFGDTSVAGNKRTVSLVNPLSNGSMHVMGWMGQFHRRLMLSISSTRALSQRYVHDGIGQGFVARDFDPNDNREYYSWWNRGTARYFPQNYQMPSLDHVGANNLRNGDRNLFDTFVARLRDGTSTNSNYPVASGNLGYAHPYGISYGGMTGGAEIIMFDGVETANSHSHYGSQAFKALHRMQTDRQSWTLVDADGSPSSVETWRRSGSAGDYVPFENFNGINLNKYDPFGVGNAPQFQINYVANNGLKPSYENVFLGYDPHDYQHFVRYTHAAKVLVWLLNDALAKDDLRMQSESFHLAYHSLNYSSGGAYQGTGLKADQIFVSNTPGNAVNFGRGEAWGYDCAAATYAYSDQTWRNNKLPWFREMADMVAGSQIACSGFVQGLTGSKFLGNKYRARQQIEHSIIENMFQGVRETVFKGADLTYSDLLGDVLSRSLQGFISDLVFAPGFNTPRSQSAVGPRDGIGPPFCTQAQIPSDGYSKYNEAYQDWSSFAYGYELTGDTKFLDRAELQFGAGVLYTRMINDGLNNIGNRAALLALVQRLNGDI